MWKWLHPYAKPETQYYLCGKFLPWLAILTIVTILVGVIGGLIFAPTDINQGDAFRIIYIHVPMAIGSMAIYASMALAAFIGLVWQIRQAYLSIIAMAPIGAVFTFLTLVTGAIWGKPMWGTWWVWDARLTSYLLLFFLYLGIMALYSAYQDKRTAGKASAILALVGVINLPVIHFSVQWWNTLHQGATITKFSKPAMATSMLIPLLISLLGFLFLTLFLSLVRYRNELLIADQKRDWVKKLAKNSIK